MSMRRVQIGLNYKRSVRVLRSRLCAYSEVGVPARLPVLNLNMDADLAHSP